MAPPPGSSGLQLPEELPRRGAASLLPSTRRESPLDLRASPLLPRYIWCFDRGASRLELTPERHHPPGAELKQLSSSSLLLHRFIQVFFFFLSAGPPVGSAGVAHSINSPFTAHCVDCREFFFFFFHPRKAKFASCTFPRGRRRCPHLGHLQTVRFIIGADNRPRCAQTTTVRRAGLIH